MSLDHPFEIIHIYDPAIWFSNGEVTERFNKLNYDKPTIIHLTYQPRPTFHKEKIEEFINELSANNHIRLTTRFYEFETHNSLFLDSFYNGIKITNK